MVWLEKEAKIRLLAGKITDFKPNLVLNIKDIDIWMDKFFYGYKYRQMRDAMVLCSGQGAFLEDPA